mmetsp:Transcript_1388/g.2455  ORF Transcript_1388/g.2455 Transcript_1388/m.2455 type:complete len:89 (-) Transcript_1388:434-700(-)
MTLLAWPMYHSYNLSLFWQCVKIGVSLYYGSRMQCQVLPNRLGKLLIEQHVAEQQKIAALAAACTDEVKLSDASPPHQPANAAAAVDN